MEGEGMEEEGMEGRGREWTLDLSASSFWQSWLQAWPCTWFCNFLLKLIDRRKVKIGNRSFSYFLFHCRKWESELTVVTLITQVCLNDLEVILTDGRQSYKFTKFAEAMIFFLHFPSFYSISVILINAAFRSKFKNFSSWTLQFGPQTATCHNFEP